MNERMPGKLVGVLNFLGGVSGLLSICAIAVWGGEIKNQVHVNTGRIGEIETSLKVLTPAVKSHDDMDNERVENLKLRTTHLEETAKALLDYKSELGGINATLKEIDRRLSNLEKKP